jgi:chemotaxis protein MotB
MEAEQPIIVIKKKSSHGGHHGGAWKVAYADFVTAMMSLFIVLWLMSSTSKQTQEEIAGYFRDPKGTASKKGSEGKPQPKEIKEKKEDMAALKKDLQRALDDINELNKIKKQIEISLTEEGLRIEMVEDDKGTFFELGSAKPTPALEEVLRVLSGQLKGLPNKISIEGHTDAQPYITRSNYGNWELSTDRANEARREMQGDGIRMDQVSQVRGFADQRLHIPAKPLDPANRRVSLVVQNLETRGAPAEEAKSRPAAAAGSPQEPEKPASSTKGAATSTAMAVPVNAAKAGNLMQRVKGLLP